VGAMVSFPSNGGRCEGYLALPEVKRAPAVIVIQEWWGLVPHIKGLADRFAAAGFVALAPDLYHGEATKSPDQAGKLMMSLRIDEAEKDLRGAVHYLLEHERVAGKSVGTVGFCMGGALSLFAACRNPEVGACVVFYGGHPNVKPELAQLQCPVLGLYAGRDTFVTPEVVQALGRELAALGKRHVLHTYPEAQHAFFNDARPEVYDAAAARDAWTRTVTFLRTELEG
jgi:carboxymethylenebutenolidase